MLDYLKAHGSQLVIAKQFDEAESLFQEALELDLLPESAPVLRFELHESLLFAAYSRGDEERAQSLEQTLLEMADRLFPSYHGQRSHLLDILARSSIRFGRLDDAETYLRQHMEIQKEILPSGHKVAFTWPGSTHNSLMSFDLLNGISKLSSTFNGPDGFSMNCTAGLITQPSS